MSEQPQMSSYSRLFDGSDPEFSLAAGQLMRHFHSQVIKQGGNLEKFIEKFVQNETTFPFMKEEKKYFKDLDSLDPILKGAKNLLISKFFLPIKFFKKFDIPCSNKTGCEIDFIIVKDGKITLVEMKLGKDFDTKKSAGEVESLMKVKKFLQMGV